MCCEKKVIEYPCVDGDKSRFIECYVHENVALGRYPNTTAPGGLWFSGWHSDNRLHTDGGGCSWEQAQAEFYQRSGVWVDREQCNCPGPQAQPEPEPGCPLGAVEPEQVFVSTAAKAQSLRMIERHPEGAREQAQPAKNYVQTSETPVAYAADYSFERFIVKAVPFVLACIPLALVGVLVLIWKGTPLLAKGLLWAFDCLVAVAWWPADVLISSRQQTVDSKQDTRRDDQTNRLPSTVYRLPQEPGILVEDWPTPAKIRVSVEK